MPEFNTGLLERIFSVMLIAGIALLFQRSIEGLSGLAAIMLILSTVVIPVVMLAGGKSWQVALERFCVLGMMVGIGAMFQHQEIRFYEIGFLVLCLATLGFIIMSHVPQPTQ
ncbi:MAG: hypothetical protein ACPG7F_13745 [Aggregatilineales bacterium]